VREWIEANLEPCAGQNLELHQIVDRFVRRSTRAERRTIPDPEAALREALPIEGRTIVGYRIRPDMTMSGNGREPHEGGKYRKPMHRSAWSD
jgi:hypothetical protein